MEREWGGAWSEVPDGSAKCVPAQMMLPRWLREFAELRRNATLLSWQSRGRGRVELGLARGGGQPAIQKREKFLRHVLIEH